ncbi:MAG: DUF2207 domain-containing protein, partial [Patescibacteria group bacterium]
MKNFFKSTFIVSLYFLFLMNITTISATEPITDWVIRDFATTIELTNNSTAIITEKITADCGNLPDKHGIFRSLPTGISTDAGFIEMPINLLSITDFSGQKINYSTSKQGHVITWKIGNANKTVSGINEYQIVYEVKKIINHLNKNEDEFYWNILGPEWTLPIDNFSAQIIFPKYLEENNVRIDSFYHQLTEQQLTDRGYSWTDTNTLTFRAKDLSPQQALTVSLLFPKNFIAEYVPTFTE